MSDHDDDEQSRRRLRKKLFKRIDKSSIPAQLEIFENAAGAVIGGLDICSKTSEFLDAADLTLEEKDRFNNASEQVYRVCKCLVDAFQKMGYMKENE